MAHNNSAASEYENTMENIKKQKEMIKNLEKQPRKLNFFQKIWALIQEKIFHSQQYTREQYMGANIIDMNKQPVRANVETQDQTDGKKEAQVAKEEIVTIPEHKSILFAARDDIARHDTMQQITSNDKTYIQFKDSGYLAKVEKVQREMTFKPGVKASVEGYRMAVYDTRGVGIGTIPGNDNARPMNLQEMQAQLEGKGFVTAIKGSEFEQLIDDKAFSIKNIDIAVNSIMDSIKNPYVASIKYDNIDITHDNKGMITFTQHIDSPRNGDITITPDSKKQKEAVAYLANELSEKIILDIEDGNPIPQPKIQIDTEILRNDVEKLIAGHQNPVDWTKSQVIEPFYIHNKEYPKDINFGFEPSESPDTPGKFRVDILKDGKWESITDPGEIQETLNEWVSKDSGNINKLSRFVDENVKMVAPNHSHGGVKRETLEQKLQNTTKQNIIQKTRGPIMDQGRE